MILMLEGARFQGKSYLFDKFFEQNTDPRIVPYKFYFVNWIERLGLNRNDSDPALHYISLGNILTVMEKMASDNSKLIVFDRALYSCFVWSQLRKRLPYNRALAELLAILKSPEYRNCKTLYIKSIKLNDLERNDMRGKDMWDNMHSAQEEDHWYQEFFIDTIVEHTNLDRNVWVKESINTMTQYDVDNFIGFVNDLACELDS